MSDGHSKEPWVLEYNYFGDPKIISCADDGYVLRAHDCCDVAQIEIDRADARRIVAAVNACAGIPTEELERRGCGGLAGVLGACEG